MYSSSDIGGYGMGLIYESFLKVITLIHIKLNSHYHYIFIIIMFVVTICTITYIIIIWDFEVFTENWHCLDQSFRTYNIPL